MTPQTWTFRYPQQWPQPLMSMNDRGKHWGGKAGKTAQVRRWAGLAAVSLLRIPCLEHCTVEMVWTVRDKRRRDEENPMPDYKAFCDGMVDAGIVPDDTPQWMTKLMPRIEYVKGQCAVRFLVTGIPVESGAS